MRVEGSETLKNKIGIEGGKKNQWLRLRSNKKSRFLAYQSSGPQQARSSESFMARLKVHTKGKDCSVN